MADKRVYIAPRRAPPPDWNRGTEMKYQEALEKIKPHILQAFKEKGFDEPLIESAADGGLRVSTKEKYWVEDKKGNRNLRSIYAYGSAPEALSTFEEGDKIIDHNGEVVDFSEEDKEDLRRTIGNAIAESAFEMIESLPEKDRTPVIS